MALSKIKSTGIADSSVTSAKILDGTIANADINACAAIASTKLACGSNFETTTTFNNKIGIVDQNIALLGFKMAVNEGLTVFNLVDGIVDEFHDESGTDEGEGSNDTYDATCDTYNNFTDGASYVAGFSTTLVTEADTSTAGTNPDDASGTSGTFTVPSGITSVDIRAFGSGGGGSNPITCGGGGGGGYAEGTLAVTATQVLHVAVGRGGEVSPGSNPTPGTESFFGGGFGTGGGASGGGLSAVLAESTETTLAAPDAYVVGGSGGGGFNNGSGSKSKGGAGGGLIGFAGGQSAAFNQEGSSQTAGGGSQTQGGEGGGGSTNSTALGKIYEGGDSIGNHSGGGGAGYYGGGGGNDNDSGGGGSSYYGHPQVTSGATYAGARNGSAGQGPSNAMPVMTESAGATGETLPAAIALVPSCQAAAVGLTPEYASGSVIGEGGGDPTNPTNAGEDGFVAIAATAAPVTTSTTIVSNAFTASSEPSTSRIVVFQENVGSVTLNTDIIASISRDGGSNFTTATLADSGYVVGSSGQRILTGTATISGQPSGTNMRWKLALANNQSKVHGVSLQWK
jgi:hypothetical protein